jgi:murein DD-endopeptidase MepM/ murein hydrolase activator NlpD
MVWVLALSPLETVGAQDWTNACAGLVATISPAEPRAGSLLLVKLAGVSPGVQLGGTLAGEALHFTPAPNDSAESLASVPIDSAGARRAIVRCRAGERTDSVIVPLVVTAGRYGVDRLRVNPAFARQPDSALAARIAEESRRALEVSRLSHATPRLWDAPFQLPRAARVTSGFGRAREFNGTLTSRHMGTDFAGLEGDPVVAVNRGVARLAEAFYYGGNVVYLDHGDGMVSAYLHLSRATVASGDTVNRGQVLGSVGATGRVTGPHLHLIVRHGAVSVDPMSLFAILGDSAAKRAAAPASPRRSR